VSVAGAVTNTYISDPTLAGSVGFVAWIVLIEKTPPRIAPATTGAIGDGG
jgi:hypothetical protein